MLPACKRSARTPPPPLSSPPLAAPTETATHPPQLKHIFGVRHRNHETLQGTLAELAAAVQGGGFHWREFVMGTCLLAFLLALRLLARASPRLRWLAPLGPILACVISISAVAAGNLQEHGIKIVGSIPRGACVQGHMGAFPLACTLSLRTHPAPVGRKSAQVRPSKWWVVPEPLSLPLEPASCTLFPSSRPAARHHRQLVPNGGGVVAAAAGGDRHPHRHAGEHIHSPVNLPFLSLCVWCHLAGSTACAHASAASNPKPQAPSHNSALARKNGYDLVFDREIVSLGIANFGSAAFGGYTATGSFSRSAVNDASGVCGVGDA